jgi:hypothetical protein
MLRSDEMVQVAYLDRKLVVLLLNLEQNSDECSYESVDIGAVDLQSWLDPSLAQVCSLKLIWTNH